MSDWESGQRVKATDGKGNTLLGTVDAQKGKWVMVDLDEPFETDQGWEATKLMVKAEGLMAEGSAS